MSITQYSKIIQVAVNIGNNKISDNLILKKSPLYPYSIHLLHIYQ